MTIYIVTTKAMRDEIASMMQNGIIHDVIQTTDIGGKECLQFPIVGRYPMLESVLQNAEIIEVTDEN